MAHTCVTVEVRKIGKICGGGMLRRRRSKDVSSKVTQKVKLLLLLMKMVVVVMVVVLLMLGHLIASHNRRLKTKPLLAELKATYTFKL